MSGPQLFSNNNNNHNNNRYNPLSRTPGEPVPEKHSLSHTYRDHERSFIGFLHLLPSIASSLFNLHAWQSFAQPFSKSSLIYLLVWNPPLHTPYISSPNHCLLFATHAHTIATCFAVVPQLCHLFLVSLNFLLGTLSFTLTSLNLNAILNSARWNATSCFCLQARSHFRATYCFAHNCCTVSLS